MEPELVCRAIIPPVLWSGIMEAIAQSVELAHQLTPSGWGFRLGSDSLMLKVGPHEILQVVHQHDFPFHLIVDRASVPQDLRNRSDMTFSETTDWYGNANVEGYYPSNPGSEACDMKLEAVVAVYPQLREAHVRVVERAASGRRLPNTPSTHSAELVNYVAAQVGRSLAQPDYAVNVTS